MAIELEATPAYRLLPPEAAVRLLLHNMLEKAEAEQWADVRFIFEHLYSAILAVTDPEAPEYDVT